MYQSLYVPLDNSDHSNTALDLTIGLASAFGARVTGSHIYAAALHDVRFKQMEFTLPDEYKEETELEKQRRIHDTLITRGLQLISDSYLAPMASMAEDAGLEYEGKTFDGKNFEQVVSDINASDYDLVLMGALGQGAVKPSQAGSVCERTLRRTHVDTLVVRVVYQSELEGDGPIVVAMDGSSWSWGALRSALALAQKTGRGVNLVTVLDDDPDLEALMEAHLGLARRVAKEAGVTVKTTSLEGNVADALTSHLEEAGAWLAVIGRHGIGAQDENPDLGSVVEHMVRNACCNVLVAGTQWDPDSAMSKDGVSQAA